MTNKKETCGKCGVALTDKNKSVCGIFTLDPHGGDFWIASPICDGCNELRLNEIERVSKEPDFEYKDLDNYNEKFLKEIILWQKQEIEYLRNKVKK